MRSLFMLSIAITAAGLLLVVAAQVLSLGATWTLIGLMLAWAGIVKVVVTKLWHGVAGLGGPRQPGDDR